MRENLNCKCLCCLNLRDWEELRNCATWLFPYPILLYWTFAAAAQFAAIKSGINASLFTQLCLTELQYVLRRRTKKVAPPVPVSSAPNDGACSLGTEQHFGAS